MARREVEITQADGAALRRLAGIFGRAFVTEPMFQWPLGDQDDVVERSTRCFAYFLEPMVDLGFVWTTPGANAGAVWVPPNRSTGWSEHPWNQPRILALNAEGGRRYEIFWDWVYSQDPDEELWQLDSIAVDPDLQGRGLGRRLIETGLERAGTDGRGAFLSTGTAANVDIYGRCGFRVTSEGDAPEGGPHVWFMRWDP